MANQLVAEIVDHGEDALRRVLALLAAGILVVIAISLAAAALIVRVDEWLSLDAALALGAIFLLVVAAIVAFATKAAKKLQVPAVASGPARTETLHSFLQTESISALSAALKERPQQTMIAGIAAGATLGLLDTLRRRRAR